jgi:hypothetical protein
VVLLRATNRPAIATDLTAGRAGVNSPARPESFTSDSVDPARPSDHDPGGPGGWTRARRELKTHPAAGPDHANVCPGVLLRLSARALLIAGLGILVVVDLVLATAALPAHVFIGTAC